MDDPVSGFEVRGSWAEIVQHGRRLTDVLRELLASDGDAFGEAFQEWEDWRPKIGDSLEGEVARRTSRQASVDRGRGEKAGRAPRQDIRSAGRELRRSVSDPAERDDRSRTGCVGSSIRYVLRAVDSALRKALRTVERIVYERIMSPLSAYYFDNELVSANLKRDRNGGGDDAFVFEINVNDDELKSRVSDRLEDEQSEPDRKPEPRLRSRR